MRSVCSRPSGAVLPGATTRGLMWVRRAWRGGHAPSGGVGALGVQASRLDAEGDGRDALCAGPQPGVRLTHIRPLGRAGLVELRVDLARRLLREARDALELLLRRIEEPLDGAEMAEDRPPSHRTDALQRLEDGLHRLRVAPLSL